MGRGGVDEFRVAIDRQIGSARLLAAAEPEGDFEISAMEKRFDFGFAFGIDDQEIMAPLGEGLIVFEISDAGEVAENPGEGIVTVENDRALVVLRERIGFCGGEERIGDAVEVLVGLDVNIGLGVIGKVEKIELDAGIERCGEEREAEQPPKPARGFCD